MRCQYKAAQTAGNTLSIEGNEESREGVAAARRLVCERCEVIIGADGEARSIHDPRSAERKIVLELGLEGKSLKDLTKKN